MCVSCVPSLSAMLSRSLSEPRISLHLLSFACLCFLKGNDRDCFHFSVCLIMFFFFAFTINLAEILPLIDVNQPKSRRRNKKNLKLIYKYSK